MRRKRLSSKTWLGGVPIFPIFLALMLTGCQTNDQPDNILREEETIEDITRNSSACSYSNISQEECLLCGDGKGTLLPLYQGQKNLGIINLNTFDLAPITVNKYDDSGILIEKPDNGSSTHITNTGKDGFSLMVTADIDRGYASGTLSFINETLDREILADHLCLGCLNDITEGCYFDSPLSTGVIDFSTGEVRLFEENILAFTLGDYYVSCKSRDDEEENKKEIDLLVFYCPERYQD